MTSIALWAFPSITGCVHITFSHLTIQSCSLLPAPSALCVNSNTISDFGCFLVVVVGGGQMRLLLVTTRDVKPGEQLFWDYRVDDPADDDPSQAVDDRDRDTSQDSQTQA